MKPRFLQPILSGLAALGAATILPARLANGHTLQESESVHFNTMRPDFGTPVRSMPLGFLDSRLWSAGSDSDASGARYPDRTCVAYDSARLSHYDYYDSDDAAAQKAKVAALYSRIDKLVQARAWRQARQVCLKVVQEEGRWTGDIRDRIGLLDQIIARKRITSAEQTAVKTYVKAVTMEREGYRSLAKSLLNTINRAAGAGFLRDRVSYQFACIAYKFNHCDEAAELYRQCVDKFPRSPKREDALIMIARIYILQGKPDEKAIATGVAAIRQLLALNPRTRFYNSALGLRARVHFLRGEYSDALWCYFRLRDLASVQLVLDKAPHEMADRVFVRLLEGYLRRINDDSKSEPEIQAFSVWQVNRLRNRLSLDMIRQFQSDLKSSAPLLVSYIYYRLYYTNTRVQDIVNLADLARSLLTRITPASLTPAVEVRLAEVEYQRRQYPQCVNWATRALTANQRYDRALFIRASAEEKMHKLARARADLAKTLVVSTDSALRTGSRQLLALVCEHQGDVSEALNQYFALGYDYDVAYMLDVRMNTKQIEDYLRHCTDRSGSRAIDTYNGQASKCVTVKYKQSQLLEYALGIRFLRQENWVGAKLWLLRVPASIRREFDTGRRQYEEGDASPDALKAVLDLERLQQTARAAHGYEAKAAAAYRYASYYHNNGELLLYNAILWHGERVIAFEEGWNTPVQTTADTAAQRDYFHEHETFLRSRELCLHVANEYPRSKVAPQALYRAACASYRVEALAWWFQHSHKGFQYKPHGEPETLLRRLANLYPHSRLVPNALKYAAVFAAESRPRQWPNFAGARRPGRNQSIHTLALNEVKDAEIDLMGSPATRTARSVQ